MGASGSTGLTGATGVQGITGASGATGPQGVQGNQGPTGLTGATGIQGIQGASGSTGLAGSSGATGATGIDGASGATGARGSTGVFGSTGATGSTGPTGLTGATGSTGASGVQGASGSTGATGFQGASGATGFQGASGASGINGATGSTGPTGVQGASGSTGAIQNWVVKTTTYTAVNKDAIVADTSAAGFTITLPSTPGTGWSVSFADPAGTWNSKNLTVARNGSTIESSATDLVLDVNYVKVDLVYDGTTWQVFANVGPQGASGINGTTGPTGSTGATGITGASGASGATGYVNLFTAQLGAQTGATGATGSVQIRGSLQVGTGATGATGVISANSMVIGSTGVIGIKINSTTTAQYDGPIVQMTMSGATGVYGGTTLTHQLNSAVDLTDTSFLLTQVNGSGGAYIGTVYEYSYKNNNHKWNNSNTATNLANLDDSGFHVNSASIGASGVKGAISYGTLNYSDGNILASFSSSVNSYNQMLLQNTSAGTAASTNFIVSNDQATNSTNYGEFGMNSSGFTQGASLFNTPSIVYVAAQSSDLALGTYGAKSIYFITNDSAAAHMTINSTGNVRVNNAFQVGTGATGATGAITASGNINATANIASGTITVGTGATGATGVISASVSVNAPTHGATGVNTVNLTAQTIEVGTGATGATGSINANSGSITSNLALGTLTVGTGATGATGSITASGTITATDLNTSSDKRVKKNIKPIKNALDMLDQIKGVSFDWKKDSKKSYGVIAQELQKVFPELVGGTEDSLAVSYIPLIAILIEAVKEQQKQIDELKEKINDDAK